MKILFLNHHDIKLGLVKAFSSIGYRCLYWSPQDKPAFDVFSEFEPDVFVGTTDSLDRAIFKNIKQRQDLKVIIHQNESSTEYINELKPTPYKLIPAADILEYYPVPKQERYECDIAFVGGFTEERAEYLIRLMTDYKVKLFGNSRWPFPEYLGYIQTSQIRNIYSSAKICPHIGRADSERIFSIFACGGFCVTSTYSEWYNGLIPYADNAQSMNHIIIEYLGDSRIRKNYSKAARLFVVKEHTYFDRAYSLMESFAVASDIKKMKEIKEKVLQSQKSMLSSL